MTVAQGLVLGVVQGLTEFLPISSSGHLLVLQQFFGLQEDLLTFDIVIHLATLIAIILFFGRSLFKVSLREWIMVGVATVPAVIVGVLFKDFLEALFGADKWVGVELILTGMIVLWTDWRLEQVKNAAVEEKDIELGVGKSFLIGIAQAIAIIPGISRSGSTVAGSIALGLPREQAFRFSFLLAIPAIAGAGILQLKDVVEAGTLSNIWTAPYVVGAIASLITGVLSLRVFKYVIDKAKLEWFGWYCVVLGIVVTGWLFTH